MRRGGRVRCWPCARCSTAPAGWLPRPPSNCCLRADALHGRIRCLCRPPAAVLLVLPPACCACASTPHRHRRRTDQPPAQCPPAPLPLTTRRAARRRRAPQAHPAKALCPDARVPASGAPGRHRHLHGQVPEPRPDRRHGDGGDRAAARAHRRHRPARVHRLCRRPRHQRPARHLHLCRHRPLGNRGGGHQGQQLQNRLLHGQPARLPESAQPARQLPRSHGCHGGDHRQGEQGQRRCSCRASGMERQAAGMPRALRWVGWASAAPQPATA